MRGHVVDLFAQVVRESRLPLSNSHVAVVGGSDADPEVQRLITMGVKSDSISYFGIEPTVSSFRYLDLNFDSRESMPGSDLVICSQVLEHVYDVKNAIVNLVKLTKTGGYLWINCPASSRFHGAPHFYSSGYSPELILKLLEGLPMTFQVLAAANLGSARATFYEHVLRRWPDEREFNNPLLYHTAAPGSVLRAAARWVRYLPQRIAALAFSPKVRNDTDYLGHTCVFVQITSKLVNED